MSSSNLGSSQRWEDNVMLPIGGITALSTLDFPDHLSCIVFTQGCPLRCNYCHNPHLIPYQNTSENEGQNLSWCDDVKPFLESRQGLLEAVVFSGGEPTIHSGLSQAIIDVRSMGFKVGLHTAGVNPEILARLLSLIDWVGLDIKAPVGSYDLVTGRRGLYQKNRDSLDVLLASGIDYECRTTVDWHTIPPTALLDLARELAGLGVRRYAVQVVHRQHLGRENNVITAVDEDALKQQLTMMFPFFEWRASLDN